jgi:hypothetical protein
MEHMATRKLLAPLDHVLSTNDADIFISLELFLAHVGVQSVEITNSLM